MGRKRRLFKGAARVAAKLMACHCGHPGCTVGSHYADVDHLDEWHRDNGSTDVDNSYIRCRSHNPFKHRLGLVDRRSKSGQVVTFRRDGTPMLPVGCRLPEFEPVQEDRTRSDASMDEGIPLIRVGLASLKHAIPELRLVVSRRRPDPQKLLVNDGWW